MKLKSRTTKKLIMKRKKKKRLWFLKESIFRKSLVCPVVDDKDSDDARENCPAEPTQPDEGNGG